MSTRAYPSVGNHRLAQLWHTRTAHHIRAIVVGAPLLLILMACQSGAGQTARGTEASATASTAASRSACEVRDFEASVLQGKDAGLKLQGTLILQADASGRLTTRLTTAAGTTTTGGGQVTGRAINLEFDLGGGKHIFGAGTLDHDFAACTGVLGGTFAGPDPADTGAWGCSCCPCYIRTISPTLGLKPLRPFRPAARAATGGPQAVAIISGKLAPARGAPLP